MDITVAIGTWHETTAREITRCPSYYAADTETLDVTPGDYPARVTFQGGYTVPMPKWLLVGIDTVRRSGRLYSGMGGNNFASTELPKGEAVTYHLQNYAFQIADHVNAGKLTLNPGFEWLLATAAWEHPDAPKTWQAVRELADPAAKAGRLYYCKACGHLQRGHDCDLMKCEGCGATDWSPRSP